MHAAISTVCTAIAYAGRPLRPDIIFTSKAHRDRKENAERNEKAAILKTAVKSRSVTCMLQSAQCELPK